MVPRRDGRGQRREGPACSQAPRSRSRGPAPQRSGAVWCGLVGGPSARAAAWAHREGDPATLSVRGAAYHPVVASPEQPAEPPAPAPAPRFTVFTPTRNRAHTLPRVYDSVRAQTFRDFEWLIVDNESEDGTDELMRGWIAEADFPIRYVQQENR